MLGRVAPVNRPARESARGRTSGSASLARASGGGGASGLRPVRLTVPRKGRRLTDDVQTLRRGHPGVAASRERGSHWRTLRWVMRKMSSHVTRAFCSGSRRRRVAASAKRVSSSAAMAPAAARGPGSPPLSAMAGCRGAPTHSRWPGSGGSSSGSGVRGLCYALDSETRLLELGFLRQRRPAAASAPAGPRSRRASLVRAVANG